MKTRNRDKDIKGDHLVLLNEKIFKSSRKCFEIFSIDKEENVFWVFKKTGKPDCFWNNEIVKQLEEVSFSFGKHDFEIVILGIDSLGRKFIQKYLFSVNYTDCLSGEALFNFYSPTD